MSGLQVRLIGVLFATTAFAACSSESTKNLESGGTTVETILGAVEPSTPAANETTPLPPETTVSAEAADDLCSTIPDLAAIEAAIGVPVKNPLGIGDAGYQQSCTLQRARDDFPGITFTMTPGRTIAQQIEFAKTNFNIDIVPLVGADGFFQGEGDSVYYEANSTLYQTSASIDGDSRAASLNLLKVWLGL